MIGIFQEKSSKDEDTFCVFVDDAVPGRFADAVFCIFDGHAGKLSAAKCAEDFLNRIAEALPEEEKKLINKNNNKQRKQQQQQQQQNNNNSNRRQSFDSNKDQSVLDDREDAKKIWPSSLEQSVRDAASKINHDMRVTGRDGTTALIVMVKRALDTNIAYVKTAWVGDTRAVIRYKNRTFNLSEDHTAMNLNERLRMSEYYRVRAKKSRKLQKQASKMKLTNRNRNKSLEDIGSEDSSNPSIEGGLAYKEWKEKSQMEKEQSIRGGSEMLTRFAGGRRASETMRAQRKDSLTETANAVKEKEEERGGTPPPILNSLKSPMGLGSSVAAAKLADLSLKVSKDDARNLLKEEKERRTEKKMKKEIRALSNNKNGSSKGGAGVPPRDSSTDSTNDTARDSVQSATSSSDELEESRTAVVVTTTTTNFNGGDDKNMSDNDDDDDDNENDIYATLFPFKIEDIPSVNIDRSGLVSASYSRRNSFVARIKHEESNGLSAPRIVARTGVSCAFSRSIGDSGVARAVICTPEFRDFTIAAGEPARIVLASDGCWDVFTSDEATMHVESLRDADHTRTSDISTRGGSVHNNSDTSIRGGATNSSSDGAGMYADLSVRYGQNSSFRESAPGIPAAQAAKKLAKSAKQRRLYRSYPPDDITVIVVDINLKDFEVVDQPGCSCVVS